MATRGGRGGWAGDKPKRFMMVGAKDPLPGGAKTGVVAPVPINTPSLRQEIHGSQGDTGGIASINRSSAGGGWGSAAGVSPASAPTSAEQGAGGGKGKGRGDGSGRQGGDDIFTRHFPDLRAGLEQAEKLDAVTKASSKVAPLRKPKPEPVKGQGPSLRPRAMLKPTGSAGGGSAATAAAQAEIADAVHNRVPTAPKAEERSRPVASFADEISTKSRWTERAEQEGAGARGRRGGRGAGGSGGPGRGAAWETNKGRGRESGKDGRGFDRGERGGRDAFQDKDRKGFRQNPDRVSINTIRGRESIFGSGAHVGVANSSQDSASNGGTKTHTTTYVRQHGPPPRKSTTPSSTPSPAQRLDQPPASQQPTRSSAYSASTRPNDQSRDESWGKSTETSSKWRSVPSSSTQQTEENSSGASPPLDSPTSYSTSYARAHGPPRRSVREGQADELGSTSTSLPLTDGDTGGESMSRFGSAWGASEQARTTGDKELTGGGDRNVIGRWKEPAGSLAPPPPPTNTRWKEPKEEPRDGAKKWKAREEGQMGGGRWGRSVEQDGDVGDSSGAAALAISTSPSQTSPWKESADENWGLEIGEDARVNTEISATAAASKSLKQQLAGDGSSVRIGTVDGVPSEQPPEAEVSDEMDAGAASADGISPEDATSFRGPFTQQQQQAQPVMRNSSWEPQLPRGGGDLWENPGHGRDNQSQQQGSAKGGSSTSGGASQPWSDPWGTSGFGLSASGDPSSRSMASFLDNAPDEPRKDRYLPPALRNRASSQGQEPCSNVPSVDEEADPNPASLPDVRPGVSGQDLVIPGGGSIRAGSSDGSGAPKAPLYEQQQQQQQQQQQRQQQETPLEEWQQRGAQATHLSRQDQTARPVEPQLHQQQPIHQSHQGQPAQPVHLHDQSDLDQGYQRSSAENFSTFQPQDAPKHQIDSALHQFQPEHFQAQAYHNQHAGRGPLPEQHLHRRRYHQSDHLSIPHQQFNQMTQQMHPAQHGAQHTLHQPHQQQPAQQLRQPQQGYHQGHQQLDVQTQQMHIQQHQQMQHPSSAFMQHPPSQGMGYAGPRGARGGEHGELPAQMVRPYRDVPPAQQQQQQAGMPPSGAYVFQSPETQR